MSSPVSASAGGRSLCQLFLPRRTGSKSLTTDSVFPGEPAPTVPAARSASPVARLASLAEPVHSDLVAQFVPPRPHRSARRPPGRMDLSPPEAASASWTRLVSAPMTSIAGCHGVRHRSSSPVWLALSGTQVACNTSIPQVKGYFRVHRVIRRLSLQSPEVFVLSTFCTQLLHSVYVDVPAKTDLNGVRDLPPCRHDHHHSVAHVGIADVRSEPPTRAALSFVRLERDHHEQPLPNVRRGLRHDVARRSAGRRRVGNSRR